MKKGPEWKKKEMENDTELKHPRTHAICMRMFPISFMGNKTYIKMSRLNKTEAKVSPSSFKA